MRLPRGIQTGPVATGRAIIGDERAVVAEGLNRVSQFASDLIDEQAHAETIDAVSAAEAAARSYVIKARQVRVNDAGEPAYLSADRDFDEFFGTLEARALESVTTKKAKNDVQRRLRDLRDERAVDIQTIARQHRIDETAAHTTAAIKRFVATGDYDIARESLDAQMATFSPDDEQKLRAYIDAHEAEAQFQRQVNGHLALHLDAVAAGESAAFIREFRASSEFDDDTTRSIIRTMQSQKSQWEAEQAELDATLRIQQGVERELEINRFYRGIGPTTGDHEIETFVRQYAIQDQGRINSFFRERDKHREALSVMQSDFLDPTNQKVRAQVDTALNRRYPTPAARIDGKIAFAAEHSIASVELEQFFEAGARAQGGFAQAAEKYREFREVAPQAYLPLTDDARAFYSKHITLTRAGVDSVEAANMAWSLVNDTTPQLRADRLAAFDGEGIRATIVDNVIRDRNDIPGLHQKRAFYRPDVTAEVPPEMEGDISRIAEAVFLRTGDQMAAEQAVYDSITNAWQFTDINDGVKITYFGEDETGEEKKRASQTLGPQYMRGAPGRSSEFVRKVLEQETRDRLYWFNNEFQSFDVDRIELYQPALPEVDEYGRPVWTLRVDRVPLLDDLGQVVRWTYEPIPGSQKPKQTEPRVTEAGFISLPPGASGVIDRSAEVD